MEENLTRIDKEDVDEVPSSTQWAKPILHLKVRTRAKEWERAGVF